MSVKISFMHYMKCIKVMLLVVFEKFELVCTFLLFFSCHYHCQLVKGQLSLKYGGVSRPPPPRAPRFLLAWYVCIYIYHVYIQIYLCINIYVYMYVYIPMCVCIQIYIKRFLDFMYSCKKSLTW